RQDAGRRPDGGLDGGGRRSGSPAAPGRDHSPSRAACFAPVVTAGIGDLHRARPQDPEPNEREEASMSEAPTFGRYAEIPVDRMTPSQREGYRFLVEGPRGRLPGPYKIWVHNPKLVHAVAPIGQHFTPGQSSLSEREREIAVLVITSRWSSAYPTAAHEKRGLEVGLPTATVEAIVAGLPPSFTHPRPHPVYELPI